MAGDVQREMRARRPSYVPAATFAASEPGRPMLPMEALAAGSKGVTMYKLTCCLAVAVEPGEGQMDNVCLESR